MAQAGEQPFQINVSDEDIQLLHSKLELHRFPDELEDAKWDYGAPLSDIKRLVARWKDAYDWRKFENRLNQLPMFTRDISVDGHGTLNIHYIHQRSSVDEAIPLLFVHGWPGSFIESLKLIPLLTASHPDHPSFHLVAISLPGYGFSEAPHRKGFTGECYAEIGNKLMLSLGYEEYVTQGGDWGHLITRVMASKYGHKHVKAWHTNMPVASPPKLLLNPYQFIVHALTPYTAGERTGLQRGVHFRATGQGYFHEQSTQPQTLGYSLADSPVGLLAWIYEKLINWTDAYKWEDDEVLDWISIYWFSRAGPAASLRIYYEMVKTGFLEGLPPWVSVPTGVAYFPKEIASAPKTWVRSQSKVVFESAHKSGGHFAAYEQPDALAGDLWKMYGKGGPAYKVVPAKSGYESPNARAHL
ncbi:alpha/beta-hydrolase [Stereum hirsutum FP-91666 SS1]|uniref:alpha/beta-hydrolase n=1 Tax=Stereum hirsutum (strain FP-91666) TaxID=721885 RepID=UPI00044494EE|nr:alpha/beta-hydrolase [Stereum hirsutum FP-91666 SS1]EIM85901.1 alpha/beta-hydrolase [Stereum hirsutum FP-91666 SS1]